MGVDSRGKPEQHRCCAFTVCSATKVRMRLCVDNTGSSHAVSYGRHMLGRAIFDGGLCAAAHRQRHAARTQWAEGARSLMHARDIANPPTAQDEGRLNLFQMVLMLARRQPPCCASSLGLVLTQRRGVS